MKEVIGKRVGLEDNVERRRTVLHMEKTLPFYEELEAITPNLEAINVANSAWCDWTRQVDNEWLTYYDNNTKIKFLYSVCEDAVEKIEDNIIFHRGGNNQPITSSYWERSSESSPYQEMNSIVLATIISDDNRPLLTLSIGAYSENMEWPPNSRPPRLYVPLFTGNPPQCEQYVKDVSRKYLHHSTLLKHRHSVLATSGTGRQVYSLEYSNYYKSTNTDGMFWPSASSTPLEGGLGYGPWALSRVDGGGHYDLYGSGGNYVRDQAILRNNYLYYANMLLTFKSKERFFHLPTNEPLVSTREETFYPENYGLGAEHFVRQNQNLLGEILTLQFSRDMILDGVVDRVDPYTIPLGKIAVYSNPDALNHISTSPVSFVFLSRVFLYPTRYHGGGPSAVRDALDFINVIEARPSKESVWQLNSTVYRVSVDIAGVLQPEAVGIKVEATYPCGQFFKDEGTAAIRLSSVNWEDYRSGSTDRIPINRVTNLLAHGLTPSSIAWRAELEPTLVGGDIDPSDFKYPGNKWMMPLGTLHYSGSSLLGVYQYSNSNQAPLDIQDRWPWNSTMQGDTKYKDYCDVKLTHRSTYKDLIMGYKSRLVFCFIEGQKNSKRTTYSCTAEREEYNFSNNPTSLDKQRKIRTTIIPGEQTEIVTGTINCPDSTIRSSTTYITSIGLYNKRGDLLATGKLSRPIRKSFENSVRIQVSLAT